MDNFVVSARKYRPATFVSVVGQSHVTSTLKNAIERRQLAHAYLFCGPRGVGKTTCARIFAKAINCLAPRDNEACGECESCRSFNEGRSFNIHELDAASNNSVDDIRSLTEQVRIPPQVGRYSVYIIDEVHMLSAQAFNAFLKTLEEPPAHAVFILATTEKHKIIPTILSRCQIFDFNRIRVEDTVDYLRHIAERENVEADDESLHLIALKSDGGMRDALSMFDKAVSFCGDRLDFKQVSHTLNVLDYDTYFRMTDAILAGDYHAALTMFDAILRNGFQGQLFLAGLNAHFRDLLMARDPKTLPLLEVGGSLRDKYAEQAARCDAETLFHSIGVMTALDGTLRTATNQRLNIELGLMKLCNSAAQKKNSDANVAPGPGATTDPFPVGSPGPDAALPPLTKAAGTDVEITEKHEEKPEAAAPDTAKNTPPPTQPAPPKAAEPAAPPRKEKRAASISGSPIGAILDASNGAHAADTTEETAAETESDPADPDAQQKIEDNREEFLDRLGRERPRLATALGAMSVEGNVIRVSVPSESLYEDLMRNRGEMAAIIAEVANVHGPIVFDVAVVQTQGAARPVKVEDRLAFLTKKNPLLTDLRRELNLDIE